MKRGQVDPRQQQLVELPPAVSPEVPVRQIRHPIWTENKAKLIERYLYYFVMITKHGSYIDGFAGPQEPDKPDMWAAKLVLESQPGWLRKFYLFEKDTEKVIQLRQLRDSQPNKRRVWVQSGDCNDGIARLLKSSVIPETEATFCLLDQRTFECHWETVTRLARYKKLGNKIELFYFLANSWLDRALAASRDGSVVERWWGKSDWNTLRGMRAPDRAQLLTQRFKDELGYRSAKPWPIREQGDSGKTMYFMIHATDHEEAPKLMDRAYHSLGLAKENLSQLQLELGLRA